MSVKPKRKKNLAPVITAIVIVAGLLVYVSARAIINRVTTIAKLSPKSPLPVLEMVALDDIGGMEDPHSSRWAQAPKTSVPLLNQVMYIPWGKSEKPPISVSSVEGEDKVLFRIEWQDGTRDETVGRTEDFADAAAVMFPLKEMQDQTIMMGFLGPVNIWHWKADWEREMRERAARPEPDADFYPFKDDKLFYPAKYLGNTKGGRLRGGSAEDINAQGPGSITPNPSQNVSGRGDYKDGKWSVVLVREKLSGDKMDFGFSQDEWLIAFAIWDGAESERGARKSISDWVNLKKAQGPKPKVSSPSGKDKQAKTDNQRLLSTGDVR